MSTSAAIVSAARAPSSSSPYIEDVVKIGDSYALVLRCWADEGGQEAIEEAARQGLPFTPLEPGKLLVMHPSGQSTEVSEADVQVVDRNFLVADLCRKAGRRGQAGVITKTDTEVQLMRVLSGEKIEGWFSADEVVGATRIVRGDHVIFGHWVGVIEEVFEMAQVMTKAGTSPKRVCDTGNTLSVGSKSQNFFLDTGPLSFLASFLDETELQQIIDVKQLSVAINWLCTKQRGSVSDFERPKRFWTNIDDLQLVKASSDYLHTIGDKVRLRNPSSQPLSPELAASPCPDGHHVLVVTQTRTQVTVLWQDGTKSVGPAQDFEHSNVDEEIDVFPGDVGVFSGSTPPRVAVVQSMKSKQRVVSLRWYDEGLGGQVETVSGLEFDQHGPPPEVYGVRRQDIVLVTDDSATNGHDLPTVPRLGESEVLIGTFPEPNILRNEMTTEGLAFGSAVADDYQRSPKSGPEALRSIDWYGEVDDLLLDGRVVVRFPSGDKETLPLNRLYLLDDGLGEGEHGEGDDMMSMDEPGTATDNSWETDDEGGEMLPGGMQWEDQEADEQDGTAENGGRPKPPRGRGWADDEEEAAGNGVAVTEIILDEAAPSEPKAQETPQQTKAATAAKESVSLPADVEDDDKWKRFEMLEEAPSTHHYYKEKLVAPSKAYMSRISKEHAVLASSLPPNILVRAYEDRADLLRCLIIGPLGTPFQNAPFLFDIYLPPTKFPQEPPHVFFHSWCGGKSTRVSPNLYAEGKVCLSLLNTWEGDATESWSAARSSILQVFVSIQGLIMTENPYYTEPGFEKQMGSTEGQAASDLYNERTFVLTRAFVLRAVTSTPAADFKDELDAYYRTGLPTTGPGALKSIVEQSRQLLTESAEYGKREEVEAEAEAEGDKAKRVESQVVPGLTVLTEGAALSLKRTLASLELVVAGSTEAS